MAKRCSQCGAFMMDEERFCTKCGANAENVPVQPSPNANPYQYSMSGQTGGTNSSGCAKAPYVGPAYTPDIRYPEMSLGKWVGTIILTTFFSIISLVLLFVWGFGDGPESRKRYCKAMLIVDLISFVVGLLLYFVFAAILAGSGVLENILEGIRDAGYSGDFSYFADQVKAACAVIFG